MNLDSYLENKKNINNIGLEDFSIYILERLNLEHLHQKQKLEFFISTFVKLFKDNFIEFSSTKDIFHVPNTDLSYHIKIYKSTVVNSGIKFKLSIRDKSCPEKYIDAHFSMGSSTSKLQNITITKEHEKGFHCNEVFTVDFMNKYFDNPSIRKNIHSFISADIQNIKNQTKESIKVANNNKNIDLKYFIDILKQRKPITKEDMDLYILSSDSKIDVYYKMEEFFSSDKINKIFEIKEILQNYNKQFKNQILKTRKTL